MRILVRVLAILTVIALGACSSVSQIKMMDGGVASLDAPPKAVKTAEVPEQQFTQHYKVLIYPGLDDKYDPNPKLPILQYNQLRQIDHYCALQVKDLEGEIREMLKQGGTYAVLEGILGSLGAKAAFGSMIRPLEYVQYIGATALGGGLASGKITYDQTVAMAHGYCVTLTAYKADELEGKLRNISIIPLYSGGAKRPAVTDELPPVYTKGNAGFLAPPPR